MIPKKIHYCWFGRGKKSDLINKCIDSWKKYLPDYEIIEWNEDNFDVNICKYTAQAYESKKWAFVSDYARLYALYECGGIYLDTDMELFKSFDCFLDNKFFAGFESNDIVAAGVIGAEANSCIIEKIIDLYKDKSFINDDGSYDILANPHIITPLLCQYGMKLNGKKQIGQMMDIYNQNVFYPNSISMIFNKYPRESFSVHHGERSWKDTQNDLNFSKRCRRYLVGVARNIIGTDKLENIRDRK